METAKTHWKKLNHPEYIGAYELMDGSEKARELIVTVQKVVRQQVTGADGKKEECTVAHLNGQKPMILNATNQKEMTKIFGSPYIEDWAGKQMTLYVAKVKAFGDVVDAIRVKAAKPVAKEDLNPSHARWNDARLAIQNKNTTLEAIRKTYTLTEQNEKLLTAA